MSVLHAIESQKSKNPLANKVFQTCQEILSNGIFITFCWIPSHKDITENEDAGHATKDALSEGQPAHFELPCSDVFIKIQPFVTSMWQERFGKEVGKKLHAIMPQIDKKYYSGCKIRKDEIMFNRIRISHTRLMHSVSMENRPHPTLCDQYEGDHELTVKHILIECSFLKIIHRRHNDVTDLHKLFLNCIIQDKPWICQEYMPLCELDFCVGGGDSHNACLHSYALSFDDDIIVLTVFEMLLFSRLSALPGCVFILSF